jgi:hypothetical protein
MVDGHRRCHLPDHSRRVDNHHCGALEERRTNAGEASDAFSTVIVT